jgi:hypothetical protein
VWITQPVVSRSKHNPLAGNLPEHQGTFALSSAKPATPKLKAALLSEA